MMYHLEEREGQGKVAIASVDILAGTVLFKEKPLVSTTPPVLRPGAIPFTTHHALNPLDIFRIYEGLDVEAREKYLDLYRPFEGSAIRQMREDFQNSGKWSPFMIKVCSIFFLNSTGFGSKKALGLFEQNSRLTHSCYGNCTKLTADDQLTCCAVRNIKAGEALTTSYVKEMPFQPTHARQYHYLTAKGFTCHCPRCDALGDDTRQFNCFDATCPGSHLVREPISLTPPLPPGYAYTGVEYVEPHLLPCTVCQRSPPPAYQIAMFQLEDSLAMRLAILKHCAATANGAQVVHLLKDLLALSLPRTHAVLQLSAGEARSTLEARLESVPVHPGARRDLYRNCARANLQCARVAEAVLPDTVHVRVLVRWDYALCSLLRSKQPEDDLMTMKEDLLKPLRMRLLLYGRDVRPEVYDTPLQDIYSQLLQQAVAPVVRMEVCAFCEESPLRAAMKRSRCGACKKVMYCSVGCQKAHWKVHKLQCKQLAALST